MKDRNIEDFEFSQGYLFFWDKVERSNYFLNTIADSYCREPKEDVGGRLVSFLLGNPICDGGQWDMVVNLIEKHGKLSSENLSFNTCHLTRIFSKYSIIHPSPYLCFRCHAQKVLS